MEQDCSCSFPLSKHPSTTGCSLFAQARGGGLDGGLYAAIRALLVVRVPYSRLLKKAGFVGSDRVQEILNHTIRN